LGGGIAAVPGQKLMQLSSGVISNRRGRRRACLRIHSAKFGGSISVKHHYGFVRVTGWLGNEARGQAGAMAEISYLCHRFPPVVIQHAVWLYLRFTLSYRDVEDLLAERGLNVSYETVASWVLKFGPVIPRLLRGRRPRPSNRWHLDEMVVRIAGERLYLWRAVDHDG
jgi:hypothetical protein